MLRDKIFFRGFFEEYGNISKRTILNNELICNIEIITENPSFFIKLLNNMYKKYNINAITENRINNVFSKITNDDAFNLLTYIYKNSDARYRDENMYNLYISWITSISKV